MSVCMYVCMMCVCFYLYELTHVKSCCHTTCPRHFLHCLSVLLCLFMLSFISFSNTINKHFVGVVTMVPLAVPLALL